VDLVAGGPGTLPLVEHIDQPAAVEVAVQVVDQELDAVVSGVRRRFARGPGAERGRVGYSGILVIKHCHGVGEAPSASVVVPPWSPRRTSLNEGADDDAD
jgi:hypothetical protein